MGFRFRKCVRLFKGAEFSPTLARIDEAVCTCCGARHSDPLIGEGTDFFSRLRCEHLQPLRGCNSDLAQYSNTPSLRVAGFEDEDEDDDENEAPGERLRLFSWLLFQTPGAPVLFVL